MPVAAFRRRYVTAETIYGTILYSALIATISVDDEPTVEVVIVSVLSLLVFWAAHVYAGTIASHGMEGDREVRVGEAFRLSVRQSAGMLYAAIPALLVLIVSAFFMVPSGVAASWGLLVNLVVLGVEGFLSFAERGSPIIVRILGGVGTALFGLLMLVLNVIVH